MTGYSGTIPRMNPIALAEVGVGLRRLDRLAATVDPAAPWLATHADEWDGLTAASWIRRNLRTSCGAPDDAARGGGGLGG